MSEYPAGRKYHIGLSILFRGNDKPYQYVYSCCKTDDIANKMMRDAYQKVKLDMTKGDKVIELSDFDALLPVENICYMHIMCKPRD